MAHLQWHGKCVSCPDGTMASYLDTIGPVDGRACGAEYPLHMNERFDLRLPAKHAEGARPPLFREAMSRVAGAVTIVATDGPGGLAGLTATTFASVSDAPPTVLVCVQTTSRLLPALLVNRTFSVNTLAGDDAALADVFAGRTGVHAEARFAEGVWTRHLAGAPLLDSALVAFGCNLVEAREVATHTVLIGEVMAVHIGTHRDALVYRERHYVRL